MNRSMLTWTCAVALAYAMLLAPPSAAAADKTRN